MAITIAICNQKGGVGKSTTAVNLGAYLTILGKKTLLIDLDSQSNATTSCGIARNQLQESMYNVIIEGVTPTTIIQKSPVEGFDVLPSSIDLAGSELRLSQLPDKERVLKNICQGFQESYDIVIFDCPPSLGLITINALVAANCVIIPVQCEYLALEGLSALVQAINAVKQNLNPTLEIGGIVFTMVDWRSNLAKEVAQEVRGFFKELVFEAQIPRNVRLAEAPSFGKPIVLYDRHSTGALAYDQLAREVLAKILHTPVLPPPVPVSGQPSEATT